ncbi:SRPBCC family protein [Agromyces arachidis]|uniref:SRPBCC family protein n=1 Tax=Agromyces arachidis TaxID=766966 RepID=UPI0040563FC2
MTGIMPRISDGGQTDAPNPGGDRTIDPRAPARARQTRGMPRARNVATAVVASLAASALLLHRLGRTYGSTAAERRRRLPGDEVVSHPRIVATHAATLPAPPERVWPWLVQVGWHRGGWYTPRWVDVLLFPDNWPSASRIHDEFQDLEAGHVIPDGPPETMCGFTVREVARAEHLVLESTTHLPLAWRQRDLARLHWTWSFMLTPVDGGHATRLVFRWRARTSPWWLTLGAHAVILPADFVMSRGMLRGLPERVATPAGTP